MTEELEDDKDIDTEIKEMMSGQEPDAAAGGHEISLDDEESIEGEEKGEDGEEDDEMGDGKDWGGDSDDE